MAERRKLNKFNSLSVNLPRCLSTFCSKNAVKKELLTMMDFKMQLGRSFTCQTNILTALRLNLSSVMFFKHFLG